MASSATLAHSPVRTGAELRQTVGALQKPSDGTDGRSGAENGGKRERERNRKREREREPEKAHATGAQQESECG